MAAEVVRHSALPVVRQVPAAQNLQSAVFRAAGFSLHQTLPPTAVTK